MYCAAVAVIIGRLPFVWLVSAVGNANCGQSTYYYNEQKGR